MRVIKIVIQKKTKDRGTIMSELMVGDLRKCYPAIVRMIEWCAQQRYVGTFDAMNELEIALDLPELGLVSEESSYGTVFHLDDRERANVTNQEGLR